ncbi:MAG: hypothetical protein QNJ63_25850 [Calothrix sp. MO_192.B10]|nr:hypothetical protein [Calothrix sp. MO_192.B10]
MAPQDRAALLDLSVEQNKQLCHCFKPPGFRHGVTTRATQSDCRRRGELVLHPFSPT